MSQIAIKWRLIPDGITSIVKLTIEGEFAVKTETAVVDAEEAIARLVSRITTHDVAQIREKLQEDRWVGDWPRPDEPTL